MFQEIARIFGSLRSVDTIDDLARLVREYNKKYDRALQTGQIFPYKSEVQQLCSVLDMAINWKVREPVGLFFPGNPICIKIEEDDKPRLNEMLREVSQRKHRFDGLWGSLSHIIEMDVLPNPVFGDKEVYLPQGRIIIPSRGYFHTFRIKQGEGTEFEQLQPLALSLPDAITKHTNPDTYGTIAIANNTQLYPLNETVAPILAARYDLAMNSYENWKNIHDGLD